MSDRQGSWMQTYSGLQFWPLDPRVEEVEIADIAHALSMMCRYGGHSREFYSVAEHSVHVSNSVPPEFALVGLLHDSAEAYVGDMVRPLKQYMGDYRRIEESVLVRIFQAFWVAPHWGFNLPVQVVEVDNRILLNERHEFLVEPPPEPWFQDTAGLEPIPDLEIQCYAPADAEELFLQRFEELMRGKS